MKSPPSPKSIIIKFNWHLQEDYEQSAELNTARYY